MRISDWSSDVCSSDLGALLPDRAQRLPRPRPLHAQWQLFLGRQKILGTPECRNREKDRRSPANPRKREIRRSHAFRRRRLDHRRDRKEHTSELQSLMRTSYDVFCLKKKKNKNQKHNYVIHPHKTTERII